MLTILPASLQGSQVARKKTIDTPSNNALVNFNFCTFKNKEFLHIPS